MDAVEGPIKRRLQHELDKVDVEKLIHDKIPEIAEQAMILQGMTPVEDIILEEPATPPREINDQEPFSDSEEERGPS